jgi:L-alanine-DL-glutamate epimerase-like enolase superfamily enzyme
LNIFATGKRPLALRHLNARPPEQLRQMAVSMPFSNLSGGIVAVPQGPGLSIEIDREVLQTYC